MIDHLPSDWRNATLLGRILTDQGPTPVLVTGGRLRDISETAPTTAQFLFGWNGAVPPGRDLGPLERLEFGRAWEGDFAVKLLAPVDLQCIKACGVTFA